MSKPSPPTPASPQVTSAAQTQSNVDTAVANAIMGNVNQSSPFGSTSYNQTGTTNVDGYNIPSYAQTTTLNPTLQGILTGQENTAASLVPTGQALANEAGTSLTTPLNFNGVNNSIIQGGPQALQQGATNTIFGGEYGLLQPIYQQQQQQLRDQLSQQGIPLADPDHRGVDPALHLQHAGQPQNPFLLMFALRDISVGAAIARHRAIRSHEREQIAFQPARFAAGVFPAAEDSCCSAAVR